MLSAVHHLLAAGDSTVELLWGLLVFAIWAVSSIAGMVAKKKEQARRERIRNEISKTVPGKGGVPDWNAGVPPTPPQRPRTSPPARTTPTKPPVPPRVVRREPALSIPLPPYKPTPVPAQRPKKKKRPAPPPLVQVARPTFTESEPVRTLLVDDPTKNIPTASQAAAGPMPVSASAILLRKWLNSQTLRQQFILTEILQPPKSLRE